METAIRRLVLTSATRCTAFLLFAPPFAAIVWISPPKRYQTRNDGFVLLLSSSRRDPGSSHGKAIRRLVLTTAHRCSAFLLFAPPFAATRLDFTPKRGQTRNDVLLFSVTLPSNDGDRHFSTYFWADHALSVCSSTFGTRKFQPGKCSREGERLSK
jgi:hypothetical protein